LRLPRGSMKLGSPELGVSRLHRRNEWRRGRAIGSGRQRWIFARPEARAIADAEAILAFCHRQIG
jgi:hypothetical protein